MQCIGCCVSSEEEGEKSREERKSNYIRLQRKRKGSNSLGEDEWEETYPTSQLLLDLLPSSSNNLYFLC